MAAKHTMRGVVYGRTRWDIRIFIERQAYDVTSVGCALFRTIMENIEDVSVVPCVDSKFVQPFRIKYKQARLIHTV